MLQQDARASDCPGAESRSLPRGVKKKGMITMPYEERQKTVELHHNVIMEGRRRISVSGVDDVESFDENEIVMGTSQGLLVLQGKELRIEKLSLDTGDVMVEGVIDKLEYVEDVRVTGGFFSRLFK